MDRWNGAEVNGLNGKRDLSEQSNGDGCWAEARRCCDVSERDGGRNYYISQLGGKDQCP